MNQKGKLVRDKIPDLIRANGHLPILGECKHYRVLLCEKLVEETYELTQAMGRDALIEECADIKEVLEELCRERKMLKPALPLSGQSSTRDLRWELHDHGRLVKRSVGAVGVLEGFISFFARTLDQLCISAKELQQAQDKKRTERGGFAKRRVLLYTMSPESAVAP